MTTAAKHSIAFHLGRSLGTVARFCLHDRNPRLRWVKRVVIVTPLAVLVATNISWILSTILTAFSLIAGIYAFSKVDSDKVDFFAEDPQAPYGRDVFGAPLNSWGEREDGLCLDED